MSKMTAQQSRRPKKGKSLSACELRERARGIKLLILDVDGVLTDGGIVLDNNGNEYKTFHVRDGHGIKLLTRNGVEVAIITGRESRVVDRRAEELGIKNVYQRCLDKVKAYDELKSNFSLADEEIACMGDDIVDIPIMKRTGLSITVADAHTDVFAFADMVTKATGGKCAVREVSEFLLNAKGLWEDIINGYMEA